jgi:HEAT repeat protein
VATVVALLGGALERLPAALDPSAGPLDAAVARLATPELLIVVAEAIARRRVEREQGVPVLARARGAADVVARLVVSAATPADRGAHRDTLAGLGGGEAQLVRLLDHGDPAVAAAAAEGLGQVGTAASHAALARALAHPNAHVRRATAAALGQLRAVSASGALRTALRDGAADVRTEAANALVALGGAGIGAALADALDGERHPAAQGELLSALGRLATPDAVQVLVQAAAPAGRLFARKPVSFRCAAVAALGVARTPAALAALRELTNDREREVREAVFAAALSAGGGARRRSPER